MFSIKVDRKQAELDYSPQIQKWFDLMTNHLGKEIKESKLEFYYSIGFFLPKSDNKEKQFLENLEKIESLPYNDRLEWEISKLRINLTLSMGNFSITDRMPKKYIPQPIFDLIKELTKVKMLLECELTGDYTQKDSIPDFDNTYISNDEFKKQLKQLLGKEDEQMDLDSILDKISNLGMDSLTKEEVNYLKGFSK
jgi:hypothetical protein